MYRNTGRQYSHHPGGMGGGGGGPPPRTHRRSQFVRRRSPSEHDDGGGSGNYLQHLTGNNQQQQQHYSNNSNSYQQGSSGMRGNNQQHRNSQQQDIEDIKDICSKLTVELDLVKGRINDIAGTLERIQTQMQNQHFQGSNSASLNNATDNNNIGAKGKKAKALKRREQDRTAGDALEPNEASATGALDNKNKERPVGRQRRNQRRENNRDKENIPLPPRQQNDDSTTQAADPSSEDKIEGEEGGERVKKVYRRKKRQPFNKRGYYNRRRRMDSSERNSNDTSPQNEANGDDFRRSKPRQRKTYQELSEAEMNEVVQYLKRDFFASEIPSVKKAMDDKGPAVAKEFAYAILDHAIQDVTSPTKLSEIATNLAQVLVGDEGSYEFQTGFCAALSDLSKRGEEIVIDAPRYMDTLGQVLGQCLVAMNTGRGRRLIKRFLTKSLHSFVQENRILLLASTMRGIADCKDERFAKDIWDLANLNWSNFQLKEGTNLEDFLAEEKVQFTTKKFSPEPRKARRTTEEVEKFADDVTDLVEKRCTIQTLDDLVRDLELEADEKVDYLGTLVYAVVRGCLVTDSGESRLDTEALIKYSSILKNPQQNKKELADAISLHALTALTKLWHTLNCPQNLMSNILLALHSHGAASYDSLQTWLNSDDLKNIPGIGAARLNSKRCIEDLGAVRA